MHKAIDYLINKYTPECLILYGSYADGSFNANSDLDALVFADVPAEIHDVSVAEGVQLDVFVFPTGTVLNPKDYPQLYQSKIIMDSNGKGKALCDAVKACIDHTVPKSKEENENNILWCEKMLSRTLRGDAEGFYRWHWVLCDSLEFYSDIRGRYYFGPKKTLLWMQQNDAEAYAIYSAALTCMEYDRLSRWVEYLKRELHG